MLPVRVSDEASADINSAARWYAERSKKAGIRFIEAVYQDFAYIGQFPHGARKIKDNVRQLSVSGFPFVILYEPWTEHIAVYRVFHTSQHPNKKFRRRK